MNSEKAKTYLTKLVGLECTQVINSIGSVILIDFGKLHTYKGIKTGKLSYKSDWGLLIDMAEWKISEKSKSICSSNNSTEEMKKCINKLLNKSIEKVIIPNNLDTVTFLFQNQIELTISMYSNESSWTLKTPELYLTFGPENSVETEPNTSERFKIN